MFAITRVDITLVVRAVSQFVAKFEESFWDMVKRII